MFSCVRLLDITRKDVQLKNVDAEQCRNFKCCRWNKCCKCRNHGSLPSVNRSPVQVALRVLHSKSQSKRSPVCCTPSAGCTPSRSPSACPSAVQCSCTPSAGLISAQQSTSSAVAKKKD
ncbi:hypothetical protein H5410_054617 [Solanum commersonii]|uniref:Uncharacterized protein n=1 Tax=Solanum commersonii TaxID=4109 RepID=A0A9J5WFE0_SOLCO|nr:hypothetical protein H5410_054617 [Solanum commersonii]